MTLETRRPTGRPSWPLLVIAGAEKAGKTWAACSASSSDLIGRTLVIPVGEDDPDEYGAIPGADFEIVLHDGTYRGILGAVRDSVEALRTSDDERPGLIVVDSVSRLWHLISDDAQATANDRARRKAARQSKPQPVDDVSIGVDLWNIAKSRWENVIDTLREHDGPVILTARLSIVSVLDSRGEPTREKVEKIEGHKSLPFDVGGIVKLPAPGEAVLSGVRSTRMRDAVIGQKRLDGPLDVDRLWRAWGMADEVTERHHSGVTTTSLDEDVPQVPGAEQGEQQRPAQAEQQRAPQVRPPSPDEYREAILTAETLEDLGERYKALAGRMAANGLASSAEDLRAKLRATPIGDEHGEPTDVLTLFERQAERLRATPQPEPQPQPEPEPQTPPQQQPDERPAGVWSAPSSNGLERRTEIDDEDPWATAPAQQAPVSQPQAEHNVREILGGTVVDRDEGPHVGAGMGAWATPPQQAPQAEYAQNGAEQARAAREALAAQRGGRDARP